MKPEKITYIGNESIQTIVYGDMSTGQILLGEKQPTGYVFKGNRTLNVIGGMLIDSVRVTPLADWADYVFSNDYKLRPLKEVEEFINTNKHLPNIPSAAEVSKNGINLAEMNTKLLEKVEELTLYLLQQQKQLDEQKQQIEELKKSMKK